MSRILIVEDEPTIAAGLEDNLRMEGYSVDVVDDGVVAESQASAGGYDLILLDVMLPGKDGFSVCRALRAAGVDTPIILLTAKRHEVDKVLGLELGADDYVTKPFSPRELLARIKAVLRRYHEPTRAIDIYRAGNLCVDFRRCEATLDGEHLALTATEFKMLGAFIHHRGEVLTLDRLIELVWGEDISLTDRVVYTHVNNLRGKIEKDPSRPALLVSVRGIGYRFDG